MIVFEIMLGIIFWVLLLAMYFMPTLVAARNKKPNITAIFILNLFFGWTVLGWFGALIWSYCK